MNSRMKVARDTWASYMGLNDGSRAHGIETGSIADIVRRIHMIVYTELHTTNRKGGPDISSLKVDLVNRHIPCIEFLRDRLQKILPIQSKFKDETSILTDKSPLSKLAGVSKGYLLSVILTGKRLAESPKDSKLMEEFCKACSTLSSQYPRPT